VWKTSENENPKMGLLPKLQKPKMESGKNDGCWKTKNSTPFYVVTSPKIHIFTKLPLLGAGLQKCHYWASNLAHSLR